MFNHKRSFYRMFRCRPSRRKHSLIAFLLTIANITITFYLYIEKSNYTNQKCWTTQPTNVSSTSEQAIPTIHVITPTYARPVQIAELTRLAQTLRHVSNVHWIVVEEAAQPNLRVQTLLTRLFVKHTYLYTQAPVEYELDINGTRIKKRNRAKGVANRLAGLDWLKARNQTGVVYFCDDDNSYDVRLFEEMRWTTKVSMWPVGLASLKWVSTPIVANGSVIDFYDGWIGGRRFPVDMAGFAVNLKFLWSRPSYHMVYLICHQEDTFLKSLQLEFKEIEPKAKSCTKILVWHVRTYTLKIVGKMSQQYLARFSGTNVWNLYNEYNETFWNV